MQAAYPTYTYSAEDARNQVARFVRLDNPESYPFDNFHAHAYNEILVFIKGGGTHNINLKNHAIQDNSLHMLAANDLHWVERSMQSSGFAIVYKEQFLHKLQLMNADVDFFSTFDSSRVINLDEQEALGFRFIFRELLASRHEAVYMLHLIGAFLTKIALLGRSREQTSLAGRIYDPLVPKAVFLVEKHYKEHLPIAAYAAMLHIEPRTLQNRIRRATGSSLHRLEQDRLLREAKRLLCVSELNINEIAAELGFKATAHFTNWFRKMEGCPPTGYKYEG